MLRAEVRSVIRYFVLATAIAWIAWLPLVLSRTGLGLLPFDLPMSWTVAGTLGPMAAALLMWRREGDGAGKALRALLRPSPKALGGAAAGVVLVAGTFVIGTSLILSKDAPSGWRPSAISLYGFHFLTSLVGGPAFEEWGWRGFAQPRLQAAYGPLAASLLIGVGWASWHLPLFLVPTWSSASIPAYVGMVTALAVVTSWGFNASGQWIIAAILMHFAYNASSRVLGGFLENASIRTWPDPVTAILCAFSVIALLLILVTRGRLGMPGPGRGTAPG